MLTTSQQPDVRALAAQAERAQSKAKEVADARARAFAARMQDAAGRALVWEELAPTRTEVLRADMSNRIDERASFVAIAKHDAAIAYLRDLETFCPEQVVAMVREAMERRKEQ